MYREFIRLAIPSVCEMVLISLINMMDTIMVSGLGTDAVAAVGLVDQPRMLMLCFFFALNVGITAVVARRKGEGRKEEANQVVRNMILIILGLSFVLMALALPFADPLMRFAGAEKGRTLEDATKYFLIVGAALPANALSMGICAAQRGIGNTKLTMYVNITSNMVNICFNYLLINGIGPFPRLGVVGAAIATAMGMVVGLILCLVSLFRGKAHDSFLQISLKDDWRIKKRSVMDVLKVSSSAMLEQIAMRIGFFSYAKIVAELGTDAFAAHQIAMKFLNLSFCFADGWAWRDFSGRPDAGPGPEGAFPYLRHYRPEILVDCGHRYRHLLRGVPKRAGIAVHPFGRGAARAGTGGDRNDDRGRVPALPDAGSGGFRCAARRGRREIHGKDHAADRFGDAAGAVAVGGIHSE